jgi:hypothetical protein
MANIDRIVATALLTARDLEHFGANLRRAFPVDYAAEFNDLLLKIDQADLVQADMVDV